MGELMDDVATGHCSRVTTEERASALFRKQAERDSAPWHYGTMSPTKPDGFGVSGLPGSPESAYLMVVLRDCIASGLLGPESEKNLAQWVGGSPLISFRAAYTQGVLTNAKFWVYRPVTTPDGDRVAGEFYSLRHPSSKGRNLFRLFPDQIPTSLSTLVRPFCPDY